MSEQQENLVLKELRKDHTNMLGELREFKGEVLTEIKHLTEEIRSQHAADKEIHSRIDKKDDRIRELEKKENVLENRLTALETKSGMNRVWIVTGISAVLVIATVLAIFF